MKITIDTLESVIHAVLQLSEPLDNSVKVMFWSDNAMVACFSIARWSERCAFAALPFDDLLKIGDDMWIKAQNDPSKRGQGICWKGKELDAITIELGDF